MDHELQKLLQRRKELLELIVEKSEARFIVGAQGKVLSEHENANDAQEALALSKFATKSGNDAAIYKRTPNGWEVL